VITGVGKAVWVGVGGNHTIVAVGVALISGVAVAGACVGVEAEVIPHASSIIPMMLIHSIFFITDKERTSMGFKSLL